jgi:hypothetical protein
MRRQEIYMKYNKTTWFSIIHSSGKEAMAAILDLSLLKDLSPLNSTFVVSMTTGHAVVLKNLKMWNAYVIHMDRRQTLLGQKNSGD